MTSSFERPLRVIGTHVYPSYTAAVISQIMDMPSAPLAEGLEQPLCKRFPSGAPNIRLLSEVRGCDVFIISPLRLEGSDFLFMAVMADTAKRASAARVTAVLPYLEGRQDRKSASREPITVELALRLLKAAGVDRFISLDLHTDQIQGMTPQPLDHLSSTALFIDPLRALGVLPDDLFIIGPDYGSLQRNASYAALLHCGVGFVDKRRGSDKKSNVFGLVGEVEGKTVLLIDDMVSTGKSVSDAVGLCREHGCSRIIGVATHPIFSDPDEGPTAVQRIADTPIETLFVSDTVPLPRGLPSNVKVISSAPLIAQAIVSVHSGSSISRLIPKPE